MKSISVNVALNFRKVLVADDMGVSFLSVSPSLLSSLITFVIIIVVIIIIIIQVVRPCRRRQASPLPREKRYSCPTMTLYGSTWTSPFFRPTISPQVADDASGGWPDNGDDFSDRLTVHLAGSLASVLSDARRQWWDRRQRGTSVRLKLTMTQRRIRRSHRNELIIIDRNIKPFVINR